ncbi:MAG: hypothetical protein JRI57_00055 [Deltaproteobacteria bacterium]|nr:hypothetical protein [Deltaproteobacteria bacterium]MBW1951463.1 hypothetical protein [Deltaproteobacteria bacterium]MBW1986892.1 hypothetical protein [Deltaproteobacteria bacterium]MBW2135002.1 hypothetical protein [Deltaproteobacteria bacterium]
MVWLSKNHLETLERVPKEYETLTIAEMAVSLTPAKIRPEDITENLEARGALLSLEVADIRFRLDGQAPAKDEGHLMGAGDSMVLWGTQNLRQFKAIQAKNKSGILRITYFF